MNKGDYRIKSFETHLGILLRIPRNCPHADLSLFVNEVNIALTKG